MRRMERNGKYVLVLNCVHFGYLVEFSNEPLIICIRVDIADKEPFAISAIQLDSVFNSKLITLSRSLILEQNGRFLRQHLYTQTDFTEFYNLIYEYKNDCLVAGVTYNKTYYEDRDLVPSEDLMFKLTLIPITTVGQSISN